MKIQIIHLLFPIFFAQISQGQLLSVSDIHQKETEIQYQLNALRNPESSQHRFNSKIFLENFNRPNFDDYFAYWYQFHHELLKKYDHLNISKQAWVTYRAWNHYNDFQKTTPAHDLHDILQENFTAWEKDKASIYGSTPELIKKKSQRHWSFHSFFIDLEELYQEHHQHEPRYYLTQDSDSTNLFSSIKRKTCQFIHASCAAWHIATLLPDLIFQHPEGFLGEPISQKIDRMLQKLRNFDGVEVHISNEKGKIPTFLPPSSKHVYLMLPIHQHALLDGYMMSSLDLQQHLIFSNPKAFAPTESIAKRIADHPQFISVGVKTSENRSAIEQLIYALENEIGNVLINYPQGHLEPNFVFPINGAFGERMIGRLVDDGYQVHITPLMWQVPSSFPRSTMNFANEFPDSDYTGYILPSISPEIVLYLRKKMHDPMYHDLFDVLLRSIWLQEKTTYVDLSLDEMLRRVQEMENGTPTAY